MGPGGRRLGARRGALRTLFSAAWCRALGRMAVPAGPPGFFVVPLARLYARASAAHGLTWLAPGEGPGAPALVPADARLLASDNDEDRRHDHILAARGC